MNRIELQQIGKKYRKDWIFRDVNITFESNKSYVIQGPNGSGKSTFLKLCSSYLLPTKGMITHIVENREIPENEIFNHITIAAPYIWNCRKNFHLWKFWIFIWVLKPFMRI